MDNNFHIGWCPFCNQGWVDIKKDSRHHTILLLCSECDTIWNSPIDFKQNTTAKYEFIGKAVSPSFKEIQDIGWDKLIIKDW